MHETLTGSCLRVVDTDYTPVHREPMTAFKPKQDRLAVVEEVNSAGRVTKVRVCDRVVWVDVKNLENLGKPYSGMRITVDTRGTTTMMGREEQHNLDRVSRGGDWVLHLTDGGTRTKRGRYFAATGQISEKSENVVQISAKAWQRYQDACDGGAGALVALGARLLDAGGDEVDPIGSNLARIQRIETSGMDHRLRDVEVLVAGNMHNLLTGERGVARVFGPQKGASPEQVEALEAGLVHWAGLLTEAFPAQAAHRDLLTGPGTGASGGLGAGLAAGLGARLYSRFDVLMDADLCGVDLDAQIDRADLVITAEGAVDFQTPRGKIPAEVGRRAKLAGKPVIALAGSLGQGSEAVHAAGIDAVMGIIPVPMDLPEAVSRADELVTDATERALRLILLGAAIAA
nr:glycerate kinase [uncultured Actinomyces sp.]